MDDEKKTQPDAENSGVTVEASLALLDEKTGPGALVLLSDQRKLINAVIAGEIGANAEEHARAKSKVYSVVLGWLESDDPVVQQRAVRAVSKLERHRIKTLDSVTSAIASERRVMIDFIKAQGDDGPKEQVIETIEEAVAAAKAKREAEKSDTGSP